MFRNSMRKKISKSFRKVKVYVRRRLRIGLDTPVDEKHNSLLHLAVRNGDETEVLELLQRGALVNATNCENETPLHVAVQNGHPNLIDLLIENGAFTEIKKDDGATPLHMVKESPKSIECLERLLKHRADINARNATGNNLLHFVVKSNPKNIKLIKKLLQHGSNVNNLDFLNNNCIHTIAMTVFITDHETRAVTEALIDRGINLNVKNDFEETPLHIAVGGNNQHLIRILLQNGARLDILNAEDLNPFDLAVTKNNISCLEIMIKHVILKKYKGQTIKENINKTIQSNEYLVQLYREFENELKSLKFERIDTFSSRTFYDILCQDEYDVINIVKNEATEYVLGNISPESTNFYWEIVDAWNYAEKKIDKSIHQIDV